MLVPAGALQDPMYAQGRSEAVNYGTLGGQLSSQMLKTIGEVGGYLSLSTCVCVCVCVVRAKRIYRQEGLIHSLVRVCMRA